jgi:hypothetical protein
MAARYIFADFAELDLLLLFCRLTVVVRRDVVTLLLLPLLLLLSPSSSSVLNTLLLQHSITCISMYIVKCTDPHMYPV